MRKCGGGCQAGRTGDPRGGRSSRFSHRNSRHRCQDHSVDSAARDSFLVVYAVLWGAVTPSFARLRVFSTSSLSARGNHIRRQAWRRLCWGILIANVCPLMLLGGVWAVLPPLHGNALGILGGGAAGLAVTGFPRLLHAVLASDERWALFYVPTQFHDLMTKWDAAYELDPSGRPVMDEMSGINGFHAHASWGVVYLLVPPVIGLIISHLSA